MSNTDKATKSKLKTNLLDFFRHFKEKNSLKYINCITIFKQGREVNAFSTWINEALFCYGLKKQNTGELVSPPFIFFFLSFIIGNKSQEKILLRYLAIFLICGPLITINFTTLKLVTFLSIFILLSAVTQKSFL